MYPSLASMGLQQRNGADLVGDRRWRANADRIGRGHREGIAGCRAEPIERDRATRARLGQPTGAGAGERAGDTDDIAHVPALEGVVRFAECIGLQEHLDATGFVLQLGSEGPRPYASSLPRKMWAPAC